MNNSIPHVKDGSQFIAEQIGPPQKFHLWRVAEFKPVGEGLALLRRKLFMFFRGVDPGLKSYTDVQKA